MPMLATCATLAAVLAGAPGGATVTLRGDCTSLTIQREFRSEVTVDASKARVAGLTLSGANLRWVGGTLSAAGGLAGKGPAGYAVLIRGGRNITVQGATVTEARKGMVIDKAANVTVREVNFWRLREDGMIVSETTGLRVEGNRFTETRPRPSTCVSAGGEQTTSVPMRDCRGKWTDGDHPDAVQMRNGVRNAVIVNNIVSGPTAGITQMDTTGDAPLAAIRIENNRIETSTFHQITLTECSDCVIRGNRVRAAKGWGRKAIIRPGRALRCGNDVADEQPDGRCR